MPAENIFTAYLSSQLIHLSCQSPLFYMHSMKYMSISMHIFLSKYFEKKGTAVLLILQGFDIVNV